MDRNLRIRMLLGAGDRITKPFRDMAGGSKRLGQSIKATRDRLKDLERAQADIAGFRALKAGIQSTASAMQAAQARATALGRDMAATVNPTRAMTREFTKAKAEAEKLTRQHGAETRELQTLRDRLRAAGVSTGDLARHERDLRDRTADTNRELQEQVRRLDQAVAGERRMSAARQRYNRVQGMAGNVAAGGAASLAAGAALGRGVWAGVRAAQEFQSVMTDIGQKANLSRAQSARMGIELLGAAKAANQLPDALQKGVDTLSGFGLDPRKAVAMMKPIGRAATAYKAEIDDLSAAAFAANDNLKVPIEQTARVIDIMAQAGKSGAFEIKDMAGAFPSLTAGYQALGQTGTKAVADLAAALQIARKGAGDSASAATNVSNIIQKIASPATIKAFSKFGIDLPAALKRAYAEGKTPLEAIAELTKKATGGDLGKIGFLFEDAQVQQGLRPLIQNLEEYRRIRAEAAGAKGTTDTDFADRMKDSAEQSKQLKINAMALAVSLGTTLLPTVNQITAKLADFAKWIGGVAQRHPTLTKAVVLGTAAMAAFLFVMGGLGILAAAIMGPIAIMNAGLIAMGVAGGTASLGLLPIIGIVAAVVAVAAALAAVAYLIYANWDKIAAWFGGMWTGIKAIFAGAGTAISGTMDRLWSGLTAGIAAGGARIARFFGGIWDGVKAIFSMSLGDILNRLAGFVGYALGTFFRFGVGIGSWITGTLPGLLVNGWNAAWGLLTAGISASFGWLTTTLPAMLQSGWNAAWAMLTGAIGASVTWLTTTLPAMLSRGWTMAWEAFKGAMRAAFVTLPAMFFDFGSMIIQGLWNGIKSAPGRLLAAGKNLAMSLAGGFRKGADIHSPSRVFMALGGHIIGGLTRGLDRRQGEAVGRMTRLTRRMAAALTMPAIAAGAISTPALAIDTAADVARRSASIRIATSGDAVGMSSRGADRTGGTFASDAAPAPAPMSITIQVFGAPGQSEQSLAVAVRREFEKLQQRVQSVSRGSFADRPDGADI